MNLDFHFKKENLKVELKKKLKGVKSKFCKEFESGEVEEEKFEFDSEFYEVEEFEGGRFDGEVGGEIEGEEFEKGENSVGGGKLEVVKFGGGMEGKEFEGGKPAEGAGGGHRWWWRWEILLR